MAAPLSGVILDAATLGPDLSLASLNTLNVDWTVHATTGPDEVIDRIQNCDIILTNKVMLNRDVLTQASSCRYVGILATGVNNLDTQFCDERGIEWRNVTGYGAQAVAQHTLMLMLNLATGFVPVQQQVKRGDWSRSPYFCLLDHPVVELAGKHLVIVGHGELGKAVEQLALAFGMRVSVAARPGKSDDGRPSLDSLLPTADVVSLHCQLSSATGKLFNAARFALMQPHAWLINTARGGLIDEPALLHALQSGQIGGAALDGLSQEPPPADHCLLQANLSNLLITPHNAWTSREARQRLVDIAADRLAQFIDQSS